MHEVDRNLHDQNEDAQDTDDQVEVRQAEVQSVGFEEILVVRRHTNLTIRGEPNRVHSWQRRKDFD